MKEVLVSYAVYHNWANKQLFNIVLNLDEEKQRQDVMSSFPGLRATCLHMWDAESIWWQRMKLHEQIIVPSVTFDPTMQEIANALLQLNTQWIEWISAANDAQLQHVFAYHNSRKEYFKQPVWQMILHMLNHGTYHRGQIVTILRQVGVTKIPSTDYIAWSRKK